jgi:hypothetical protein
MFFTAKQRSWRLECFLVLARRDEMDYNLACIPVDFHPKRTSAFDPN